MHKTIEPSRMADFHQEQHRQIPVRLKYAILVAIVAFGAFGFSDPFVVSGSLTDIYTVRAVVVAVLLGQLLYVILRRKLTYRDGAIACTLMGLGTIAVTFATHDPSSRYIDALIIPFIGYATLVPTTPTLSIATSTFQIAVYNTAAVWMGMSGPVAVFASNNALLGLSAVASWTIVTAGNALRLKEYLRTEELAAANIQLEKTAVELRTLDKAKNDFFANVNHDLMSPIAMVLAQLQFLDESLQKFDELASFKYLVESCRRSTFRLFDLADEVLELTRLDVRKQRFYLEAVDLAEMAHAIVADAGHMVARKGLQIEAKVANGSTHDGDTVVRADAAQIDRVFVNLITNAVKFTDSGAITISIVPHDADVEVTVADTGVGISEQALLRVFERGYQEGVANGTGSGGGFGIGLYLSRRIVTTHGGTLTVASQKGVGSSFTFSLPRSPRIDPALIERRTEELLVDAERRKPGSWSEWHDLYIRRYRWVEVDELTDRRELARPAGYTPNASVLVVDDKHVLVRLLADILQPDYRVYVAHDGEEGLRQARRFKPELIISDVMMPKMTGLDLLRAVRGDAELKSIPFFIVTANGTQRQQIEATNAGVDAYLNKPFNLDQIRSSVRHHIRKQQEHAAALLDSRAAGLQTTARGMAHDILNSIHYLNGCFTRFQRLATVASGQMDETPGKDFLNKTQELYQAGVQGLARVKASIKDVQVAADQGESRAFEMSDVNTAVREAVVESLLEGKVRLELNATTQVALRPGRLAQVIMNLLKNALEAGGETCSIGITTWDDTAHRGVAIVVKDNGPGMKPEVAVQAFDPYFTTKSSGTGLGLAMCRRIVRDHGGNIDVDSEPGQGTSFHIWLPVPTDSASRS